LESAEAARKDGQELLDGVRQKLAAAVQKSTTSDKANNQALDELKKELKKEQKESGSLRESVKSMEKSMKGMKGKETSTSSEVDTLKKEIKQLESSLASLQKESAKAELVNEKKRAAAIAATSKVFSSQLGEEIKKNKQLEKDVKKLMRETTEKEEEVMNAKELGNAANKELKSAA
jgi:chromosome segregation ATPase